jgi:hypothetical protein
MILSFVYTKERIKKPQYFAQKSDGWTKKSKAKKSG